MWWIAIFSVLFLVEVTVFVYEQYVWSSIIMAVTIAGAIWLDTHSGTSWVATNLHHLLLWYIPAYLILGFGTALVKWILYASTRVDWITEAKSQFDAKKFEPKAPDFKAKAVETASEEFRKQHAEDNSPYTSPFGRSQEKDDANNDNAKHVARVQELEKQYRDEWSASLPALKRGAFVDFYAKGLRSGAFEAYSTHKIYDVDFSKETSVVDALSPRAKDNKTKIGIWISQWPVVIVSTLLHDLLFKLVKHFTRALDAMFSRMVRQMVTKATKGL